MLEEHYARRDVLTQRDVLDREVDSAGCGLFERMRVMEAANEQLTQQLKLTGTVALESRQLTAVTLIWTAKLG